MRRKGVWLAVAAALSLYWIGSGSMAFAQDRNAADAPRRGSVENTEGASPVRQDSRTSPPLVDQVLGMLRGGIAREVVQKFVESWTTPYLTGAQDLERLRAAGASRALLDAYAKRGAELRWRAHVQTAAIGKAAEATRVVILPPLAWSARTPAWSTPPPGPPLYLFSNELPWAAEAYAQQYEWASGYFGPELWWPLWR